MTDDNLTQRQQEVVTAVKELDNPTAEEVANYVGIVTSTARTHLSNVEDIKHKRGKGYYLAGSYHVTDSITGYQTTINQSVIDDLKSGGLTYGDFKSKHDLSEEEAQTILDRLEKRGYSVEFKEIGAGGTRLWYLETKEETVFSAGSGDGTYEFGLISDTHLGSAEEHLQELEDFYDRLVDRGITTVFHAGDISDGWDVYRHHHQQLKPEAIGWENLKQYVVENYPSREDIDTYYITGNHDYKLWKRSGIYFGQELDERREDLHWLGAMQSRIVFDEANGIDLELLHPSGGAPYTLGYRAQTLYRERDPQNRPSLGAIGHLHSRMQANAHGVEAFYTGAWQGPTPYVKRKGLPTDIGGWIVTLEIEDGEIRHLGTDWISYETREAEANYTTNELQDL